MYPEGRFCWSKGQHESDEDGKAQLETKTYDADIDALREIRWLQYVLWPGEVTRTFDLCWRRKKGDGGEQLLGSEGKDSVEDVVPYFAGDTEAKLKVYHQRPSYSEQEDLLL